MENSEKPKRELTIVRTFDAPKELVWKAWTDKSMVQKWWGPKGVTNPTCVWDARPGGKIEIVMLAGKELGPFAGQRWPMNGVFKEVVPQSRLVFASNALDDKQDALLENIITVDLEDLKGKTKVKIHIAVTKAQSKQQVEFMLQGMEQGWNQQTDKLGEFVVAMSK